MIAKPFFPRPVPGPVLAMLALAVPLIALPAMAAFAQGTEEQQQACTPDAVKLCSDTIPDIGKTTACMKAHFAQLTPRCQAAFSDATGGDKTKSAARKVEPRTHIAEPRTRVVEPRTHVATRAERRLPERAIAPGPERAPPAAEPVAPASANVDPTTPPALAGFPPYPSPDATVARAPASPRSQIAQACRDGLIDRFTCTNTVPALLGGSAY